MIAALQKNVTLISKFDASCGLLRGCGLGWVGGGNTQCNYDKNWMPTIIWWILWRKTQHKLQYLALTELQAQLVPGVYGRFCSGLEVWAGWAVNHLNWFQLPRATLESPAWLRTADYWFPHCIVIWLLTQLYCSELQPPGDWQGAMFQCSLMLHNVHSRSDPYFKKHFDLLVHNVRLSLLWMSR